MLGLAKQDLWGLEAVIVYCSTLSYCQNDPPMGESFWQKEGLLQYTMTLLQGPKNPVLPTLTYVHTCHMKYEKQIHFLGFLTHEISIVLCLAHRTEV